MIANPFRLPLDALLLAGGASKRMGRDKALLRLEDGRLLWQRQVEILRALGPGNLFISGPVRLGFPDDVKVLPDTTVGLGPLAGIVEGLRASEAALLVVLAVDLPAMTSDYLSELIGCCGSGRGCVPKRNDWLEPLAAVYPREALALAEAALGSDDRSLRTLIGGLQSEGLVEVREAGGGSEGLFANWNEPAPATE